MIKKTSCECGSSDARVIYEDGGSKCFSCGDVKKASGSFEKTETTTLPDIAASLKQRELARAKQRCEEISGYPVRPIVSRGISKAVTEFYGVKVTYDDAGQVDTHYYPYDGGAAYKVRTLPKQFTWLGKSSSLCGKEKFSSGGRRLTICEGEIDMLSVAEASYRKYKKFYPTVSLSSSVMTKSILENRDWVRSFKEVVLCFDEDEAGDKARKEAIKIIGIDKAKITKLPFNDANETLLQPNGHITLLECIFNAAPYIPFGILTTAQLREHMNALQDEPSIPYPQCLEGINSKVKGLRLGQIALYISGTGSGKSSIIREVILHLLKVTEDKIGIISLEETPGETARSLSSMHLCRNLANEEISQEDLNKGFDEVFKDDRIIVLDHQGSIKDETIVDQMEYMALMGCKYLFIDHITILVSEGAVGLTGNEAIDKIMNDLLRLVKKHRIHIGLVSHLRKTAVGGKSFEQGKLPTLDDIKGSGSIKQVSLDIFAFARDMSADNEAERNHIIMSVLKCRATGLTGPVAGTNYNFTTGRMTYAGEIFAPVDVNESTDMF